METRGLAWSYGDLRCILRPMRKTSSICLADCSRNLFAIFCLVLLTSLRVIADVSDIPHSFGYVLQADARWKTRPDAVRELAACDRDWIVVDAAYTSEADGRWTKSDLDTIRMGKSGRRVLAYLSIGEAEEYQSYWKKAWDADRDGKPDAGAPGFLMAENPDWHGNYRVRYWHKEWQAIMLAEIDRIVEQGFDGIYLDIVDAFETFEFDGKDWIDDRRNEETGKTYRADMITWVTTIGQRIRVGDSSRLLIPQNGSQLVSDDAFRNLISGIGMEDVFTNGNRAQKTNQSKPRVKDMEPLVKAGKPVLLIEYPKKQELRQTVIDNARSNHFVWLITDRQLKTLGESGN